ncbi:MAG: hypothetical protein ACJAQT_001766 [Akkermansiaceae bacterium]
MAFHVVDAIEGLFGSGGESFGVGESYEKRGCEAGAAGGGEGGDVIEGEAGFIEGLLDEGADALGVITAGDLGDDASEFAVDLDLGRDERSEKFRLTMIAVDNGDGSFIAGGFDGEDHECELGVCRT